jgi:hypothetical protein
MRVKIGAMAVVAAMAGVLGFAAGTSMMHAARAQEIAAPATSCGSTTACLTESNTLSGPGIKTTSNRGNGLGATTDALGSTSTNGASALFGQDLQTKTGNGLFNFGVNGTSTNGTGVQGTGGAVGVSAVTSSTTGTGILVQAPMSSMNTSLVVGKGFNQEKVFSVDSVGNAVFGDPDIGVGGSVTATGYSGNEIPLFIGATENGTFFEILSNGVMLMNGSILANYLEADNGSTIGVQSSMNVQGDVTADTVTSNYGLFSNQLNTSTNTIADDASGVTWLYQGYSTTAGKYTVEMGDSGSVYARIFITMSEPRVVQQTSSGAQVDTYTPQITQPTLEDFGEAQLTNGVASVALDPKFAASLDESARYLVTLTPEGDCRGLYVASQSAGGFVVRELQGGRSSVAFNFRIVAKPFGENAPRMPLSSLPYGFDHAVPPPVPQRAPRRPTHSHPFVNVK